MYEDHIHMERLFEVVRAAKALKSAGLVISWDDLGFTILYYPRSGSLPVSALSGNIIDEVDIEDLIIELYLRLTQECQTPKKIEDMTIVEYLEYEKKVNENHISNTKSYLPTYFRKKDMEEEVEHMTNDEVVMSEQEESNHGYTQHIQHFEEKDDVHEWLNAEITKHMTMQFEASTASVSDEVSSIASNEVDRADDNTPNTAPYAKDNIMPQRVYEYLVKFMELEFPCNFVIKIAEDVIILGRPFLESTRAQIDIFNEEISFEIGSKKFKFNTDSYQSIEKIYMLDIGQEKETFNPLEIGIDLFSYESPTCLEFEQRTRSYGTPNPHEEIAEPISFSLHRRGLVKRWHVCKPIYITYDNGNGEDCGMCNTPQNHNASEYHLGCYFIA
ncbi:hypothetical protein Tco_0821008 [Tanacetum coccineum]|uniref:Reverse transcriptase domain-containing protein n=1 Tax=Tanacetum coccineum TaxID=301880 RepID=A0ABQ5ACR8_9ASTR